MKYSQHRTQRRKLPQSKQGHRAHENVLVSMGKPVNAYKSLESRSQSVLLAQALEYCFELVDFYTYRQLKDSRIFETQ